MSSSDFQTDVPIAAEGGLAAAAPRDVGDPYRMLDDLMEAVEALCSRWPPRATFTDDARMLL